MKPKLEYIGQLVTVFNAGYTPHELLENPDILKEFYEPPTTPITEVLEGLVNACTCIIESAGKHNIPLRDYLTLQDDFLYKSGDKAYHVIAEILRAAFFGCGEVILSRIIDEDVAVQYPGYLPLMQNEGVMDMLQSIAATIEGVPDLAHVRAVTPTRTGQIEVQADEQFPLEDLLSMASDTQVQLLCYAIYLKQQQGSEKLTLDINDYFDLRGISRQTRNVRKLLDDLTFLQRTHFTFEATVKGVKKPVRYSRVLAVTDVDTRNNTIRFVFGDWVNTLTTGQYTLIDKEFFKYICSNNNPYVIRLSLKLGEVVRNNLKRKLMVHSLNVGKLITYLGISEGTIKERGFVKACKDKIDNALDFIAEKEGYSWWYRSGDHDSFASYKKDYIEFENPKSKGAYSHYKLITSTK